MGNSEKEHITALMYLSIFLFLCIGLYPSAIAQEEELSDKEIRIALDTDLILDENVGAQKIEINVDDGIVTLTGTVNNLLAKERAERIAESMRGVRSVVNNHIKVRPTTIYSDAEIANIVRNALDFDLVVDTYQIAVTVVNGVVYLNGRVNSYFEKERAEDVTSRQPGVVDIKNNIIIDYVWTRKPDWEIKEDIESQFFWSALVDGDDVNVQVDNGNVTLTGEVDTRYEAALAVKNAFEGGARSVENKLDVVYSFGRPPETYFYEGPYQGDYFSTSYRSYPPYAY